MPLVPPGPPAGRRFDIGRCGARGYPRSRRQGKEGRALLVETGEGIRRLKGLLTQSRRAVVFTGAGISTESGIPDFRSPGGLWEKNRPIDFSEFISSPEARRESWRRKFAMDSVMATAKPNAGHRAISDLYRRGKLKAVITQNIDGLHQASGIPEHDVIEIHGNTTYAKCLDCHARMELAEVREIFIPDETLPECAYCGGLIKTATI